MSREGRGLPCSTENGSSVLRHPCWLRSQGEELPPSKPPPKLVISVLYEWPTLFDQHRGLTEVQYEASLLIVDSQKFLLREVMKALEALALQTAFLALLNLSR